MHWWTFVIQICGVEVGWLFGLFLSWIEHLKYRLGFLCSLCILISEFWWSKPETEMPSVLGLVSFITWNRSEDHLNYIGVDFCSCSL